MLFATTVLVACVAVATGVASARRQPESPTTRAQVVIANEAAAAAAAVNDACLYDVSGAELGLLHEQRDEVHKLADVNVSGLVYSGDADLDAGASTLANGVDDDTRALCAAGTNKAMVAGNGDSYFANGADAGRGQYKITYIEPVSVAFFTLVNLDEETLVQVRMVSDRRTVATVNVRVPAGAVPGREDFAASAPSDVEFDTLLISVLDGTLPCVAQVGTACNADEEQDDDDDDRKRAVADTDEAASSDSLPPQEITVAEDVGETFKTLTSAFGAVCGVDMDEFDEQSTTAQVPRRLNKNGIKSVSYRGETGNEVAFVEGTIEVLQMAFCPLGTNAGGVVQARGVEADGIGGALDEVAQFFSLEAGGTFIVQFVSPVSTAVVELVGVAEDDVAFTVGRRSQLGASLTLTADADSEFVTFTVASADGRAFDQLAITAPAGAAFCLKAVGVPCNEL